jgi:hypothetical protein
MRGLAVVVAVLALLVGCMSRPAQRDRSGEVSYNRRELPPEQGVFSGRDGVFTIYGNDREHGAVEPPPPPRKTTLACERGQVCDPPSPAP